MHSRIVHLKRYRKSPQPPPKDNKHIACKNKKTTSFLDVYSDIFRYMKWETKN